MGYRPRRGHARDDREGGDDPGGSRSRSRTRDPVRLAREGDAGPDSDLDFLVIERDLPNRRQERIRLRMALDGFRTPIDVVVVSERHVEKWGDVKGTMLNAALKEGRLLAETGR